MSEKINQVTTKLDGGGNIKVTMSVEDKETAIVLAAYTVKSIAKNFELKEADVIAALIFVMTDEEKEGD